MFIVYENLGQPGARKIREFGTEREARQFIADYYFWVVEISNRFHVKGLRLWGPDCPGPGFVINPQ